MDRHFIVFYDARNNRNSARGNCYFVKSEGSFINNEEVIELIASANPQFGKKDIVLTNIQELNKKDFEQFIEKR